MYTVDVWSYTQVSIMQPPSHERYYYFLQRSQQDYHAWSKQTRAGKLTGLMLLLNHLQKDVSSRTGGTEGVSYLAPSSGSNQVQQMLFTIPSTVCFDMALGNWLDLNICMVLNVPTESYDSVLSIQSTLSKFCQSDCYVFWREKKGASDSSGSDTALQIFSWENVRNTFLWLNIQRAA